MGVPNPPIRLEHVDAAVRLLDAKVTSILPQIVLVAEEDGILTDGLHDALQRRSLFAGASDCSAVGITGRRPATLQVVGGQAGAALGDKFELALYEVASLLGRDAARVEWLDVSRYNIDDGAQGAGRFLEDVDGLSGRAWASVAGALEGLLAGSDERGEFRRAAVAIEDGFVTDDDHLNEVPPAPGEDVCDLRLRAADAGGLNENTDDHLEAESLASGADVLETGAVGSVDADGLEALGGDGGDVS